MNEFLYDTPLDHPMPSGVYALTNVRTGWRYVGSTKDLDFRAGQHFKALEAGTHHNRELQYSFDNHGPDAFNFIVLEYCEEPYLTYMEQKWLDRLKHKAYNRQWKVKRPEDIVDLEDMPYVY